MKSFLLGVLIIIGVGIAGLLYRNATEHPYQQIACPLDAEVCPDGTSVSRTGASCTFAPCPPPNVSLTSANIAFAIPDGFVAASSTDPTSIAAYALEATSTATSSASARIVLHRYPIDASSTALTVIQQTAINPSTGALAPVTAYSSSLLGTHRFTVVSIERAGGTLDTAYYLARGTDVIRFDAIDSGVANWSDSGLNLSSLSAHGALTKLLTTLQSN